MGRATKTEMINRVDDKSRKRFFYSSVVSLEIGCGIFQKINIKCLSSMSASCYLALKLLLLREERREK
jgi:hypothetical protein